MKKRNGRRACLGFQWDPGSWEEAPRWLDAIFRRFPDSRVHWNLPAMDAGIAARRRAAIVKPLRSRIESSGDVVTSMGYAGACHPLLNLDELDKELAWGLRNPWATGLADILDTRPPVLIPRMPDLLRPDAARLYREHGFTLVGVSRDLGSATVASPGAPAGWLPIHRISLRPAPRGDFARRLRRAAALPGTFFLLVDLSRQAGTGPLDELLDEISAASIRPGLTLLELPSAGSGPAVPPAWSPDWTAFTVPGLHAKLASVAALTRRKRKRAEDIRDILTRLGPREAPETHAPAAVDEETRSHRLVAHMLGEVLLAGSGFDVRLSGGRFCGIVRQGKDIVPRFPAISSIRLAGRQHTFRTTSSFSFEGDAGTGLREELTIDGEGGAGLSIEYSFRDDCPGLSISGEIRFPRLGEASCVEEYAPLAFALREVGRVEPVEIRAEAPDGSVSIAARPAEDSILVLPGARHRVRRADGGWIVLCFSCPGAGSWGIPSFRIVRHKRRRLLLANPFGCWSPLPGGALSGRRESFSMLLELEDD